MRALYKSGHQKAHKAQNNARCWRSWFFLYVPFVPFVALLGEDYGLTGGAFFEVGGETLEIEVRHLMNLRAELPLPLRAFAGTVGADNDDDGFD